MKFKVTGFLLFILMHSLSGSLHSQDRANDAIKRYKESVTGANKNFAESIDEAQNKNQKEIASATQAASRPPVVKVPSIAPVDTATQQDAGSLRDKINQIARGSTLSDGYYPIQKNKRPLTLPGGTSAWGLGLGFASLDDYDSSDGPRISQDMTFFKAAGFFGASDYVTVGFETGFGLISDDEPGSDTDLLPIELYSLFSLYKSSTVQMAGSAYLPLNISGPGDTFQGIKLGLPTRFNFADDAGALHIGGGLLSLGSDETSINLNLGLGFQLSDNFNIQTSFTLVQISGDDDGMPAELIFSYSFTPASEFILTYRTINNTDTVFVGWVLRNL